MYVVVNCLSQVIFLFLLFLGMLIYANEIETKKKNWDKKINYNKYMSTFDKRAFASYIKCLKAI